jgi:hypothetical protein
MGFHLTSRVPQTSPTACISLIDATLGFTEPALADVIGASFHLAGGSTPITKSDVARDVVVKAGDAPKRRRIDGNKSAIAHEAAFTGVKDHNAFELQVTEAATLGKKAGCRLRIYQLRPKELNLARENFRRHYSEINRVRSKAGTVLRPVIAGALFG